MFLRFAGHVLAGGATATKSIKHCSFAALFAAVLWLTPSPAGAVLVNYVDADFASNTTLADGSTAVEGTHFKDITAGGSVASDDQWDVRGFGNGSTVITSNNSGGGENENAPRLRTAITGLNSGDQVLVYAFFWGAGNDLWRGRASLTDDAGELQGFNTNHFSGSSFFPLTEISDGAGGDNSLNPGPVSTDNGADPGLENGGFFALSETIESTEGNRYLTYVDLGPVTVDGTGIVNVFIDDLANTGAGNRTWYDGVGYSVVAVPEPAAFFLVGSLAVGTVLKRRR